jgi:hypothetical protein
MLARFYTRGSSSSSFTHVARRTIAKLWGKRGRNVVGIPDPIGEAPVARVFRMRMRIGVSKKQIGEDPERTGRSRLYECTDAARNWFVLPRASPCAARMRPRCFMQIAR